jgi:hypothetical protein
MEHYAGIDVSLESSSVCVVEATGRIVREAKVASEPEALTAWFRSGRKTPSGAMRPTARQLDWPADPHQTPSGGGHAPTPDRRATPARG